MTVNCTGATDEYDTYGHAGAVLNLPPLCFSLSRALVADMWVDDSGSAYHQRRLRDDVAQWCADCIGPVRFEHVEIEVCLSADLRRSSKGLMTWGEFHRLLHFECVADMVAFKLRWE